MRSWYAFRGTRSAPRNGRADPSSTTADEDRGRRHDRYITVKNHPYVAAHLLCSTGADCAGHYRRRATIEVDGGVAPSPARSGLGGQFPTAPRVLALVIDLEGCRTAFASDQCSPRVPRLAPCHLRSPRAKAIASAGSGMMRHWSYSIRKPALVWRGMSYVNSLVSPCAACACGVPGIGARHCVRRGTKHRS